MLNTEGGGGRRKIRRYTKKKYKKAKNKKIKKKKNEVGKKY